MSKSEVKKEYILGTGQDELERLAIQHRVWADATTAAWKRAGIGPGTHVLDVGCGPGYASIDMAQLITASGKLVALDESQNFVDYLNSQAESQNIPQLSARVGDAQNLSQSFAPTEKFDAIYCRWVLCWLSDPLKTLIEMRKVLKPSGRLVIHDYFNWKAMTAAPRSQTIEKMVLAAVSSFQDRKGDVDIAGRLPALLREAGFTVTHFDVHQRAARGGGIDSTLAWVLTWWRTYGPKLVQMGKLSSVDCEKALQDLTVIENDPDRFFFCPPLFEIIATPK